MLFICLIHLFTINVSITFQFQNQNELGRNLLVFQVNLLHLSSGSLPWEPQTSQLCSVSSKNFAWNLEADNITLFTVHCNLSSVLTVMCLRTVKYWGWVWGSGLLWWGMFAGMWCCFVCWVCTDALQELATSCGKVRELHLRIAVGTCFWFSRSSLEFMWRHLYICSHHRWLCSCLYWSFILIHDSCLCFVL